MLVMNTIMGVWLSISLIAFIYFWKGEKIFSKLGITVDLPQPTDDLPEYIYKGAVTDDKGHTEYIEGDIKKISEAVEVSMTRGYPVIYLRKKCYKSLGLNHKPML